MDFSMDGLLDLLEDQHDVLPLKNLGTDDYKAILSTHKKERARAN